LKVSFAEDIFFSQNMDLREKFRQIERDIEHVDLYWASHRPHCLAEPAWLRK
jgi:hypothetical protein